MNLPYTDPAAEIPAANHSIVILHADEMVRDALAHWLEREGFVVHVARDGRDAAERLAVHGADTLIVDRVYPAWDGLGTMQAVRRSYPHLRIIVAKGDGDDPFLPLARSVGANAVLAGRLSRDAVLRELRALPH